MGMWWRESLPYRAIWTETGSGKSSLRLSNSRTGARLIVFNDTGEPTAFGPAVGTGSRWRYQLAVAPFGQSGEVEIVDVLTPHIGSAVNSVRQQIEMAATQSIIDVTEGRVPSGLVNPDALKHR